MGKWNEYTGNHRKNQIAHRLYKKSTSPQADGVSSLGHFVTSRNNMSCVTHLLPYQGRLGGVCDLYKACL